MTLRGLKFHHVVCMEAFVLEVALALLDVTFAVLFVAMRPSYLCWFRCMGDYDDDSQKKSCLCELPMFL